MFKYKIFIIERHEFTFVVDTEDKDKVDPAVDLWLDQNFGDYEDGGPEDGPPVRVNDGEVRDAHFIDIEGNSKLPEWAKNEQK